VPYERKADGAVWGVGTILRARSPGRRLPRRLEAEGIHIRPETAHHRHRHLLYGNAVIETAELEIPHPRMSDRRFVLEPFAELAPDLRHPVSKRTMRELLGGVARAVEARQAG
jgi:hypothetical protein